MACLKEHVKEYAMLTEQSVKFRRIAFWIPCYLVSEIRPTVACTLDRGRAVCVFASKGAVPEDFCMDLFTVAAAV